MPNKISALVLINSKCGHITCIFIFTAQLYEWIQFITKSSLPYLFETKHIRFMVCFILRLFYLLNKICHFARTFYRIFSEIRIPPSRMVARACSVKWNENTKFEGLSSFWEMYVSRLLRLTLNYNVGHKQTKQNIYCNK